MKCKIYFLNCSSHSSVAWWPHVASGYSYWTAEVYVMILITEISSQVREEIFRGKLASLFYLQNMKVTTCPSSMACGPGLKYLKLKYLKFDKNLWRFYYTPGPHPLFSKWYELISWYLQVNIREGKIVFNEYQSYTWYFYLSIDLIYKISCNF